MIELSANEVMIVLIAIIISAYLLRELIEYIIKNTED